MYSCICASLSMGSLYSQCHFIVMEVTKPSTNWCGMFGQPLGPTCVSFCVVSMLRCCHCCCINGEAIKYHKRKKFCGGNIFAILAGTITPRKCSPQNVPMFFGGRFAMDLRRYFQPVLEMLYQTPRDHSLQQSRDRPSQKQTSGYKFIRM